MKYPVLSLCALAGLTAFGEVVRLPVTRDTLISNVGKEADCNVGKSPNIKVKSIQEMTLFDVDTAPLRGRVVQQVTLHLRPRGREVLHRLTVSSLAADWTEGTARGYAVEKGSSCHNARAYPDQPWAYPGSDLCAVICGEGGTIWGNADAFPKDKAGWQKVAVDPRVVAARTAGVSGGFVLFDDTGSEWSRNGEKWTFRLFPNRFIYSRDAGPKSAPWLEVRLGPEDRQPPPAPAGVRASTAGLPAGEARVSWTTPGDRGAAGTIGFLAEIDGKPVPRYLVPAAGKAGEQVVMHLRDLGLAPGAKVQLSVKAVDGAGNVGPAAAGRLSVSARRPKALPDAPGRPFAESAPLPEVGGARVAILDPLDKVQPLTGAMVPGQPNAYRAANHLWSAASRTVRLAAAKNEFAAFQVLVSGPVKDLQVSLVTPEGIRGEVLRFGYVKTKSGPMPDPLLPVTGPLQIPAAGLSGQQHAALLCEVYVPHQARAGKHAGRLVLRAGDETLTLTLALQVWDFVLPDYLSFLPEMNCYGLPANEGDYYRLAHRHRTVLNRVPYGQQGKVAAGCAPAWDGKRLDWTAWDKRFGPYLDGSAFADLPRRSVPLECFYVPLHENWPSPVEGNYNGDYWADRAFSPAYRTAFVAASEQITRHMSARGWTDTLFHCYQNNKNNFKSRGWSRGSSPWLLDEPGNWQDYHALRWFAAAFHEGVRAAGGRARMVYRGDISRPQWERDAFAGLMDYYVVNGGIFRRYRRMVLDRQRRERFLIVDYGSSNGIEVSNMQPLGWCIDSWTLGSDGVLPWQTIGRDNSWRDGDRLSLFYPGGPAGQAEPLPSIRLKAYRRGQQDVEYLTLLARQLEEPRWALGDTVRAALRLRGVRQGTGFRGEDAGVMSYGDLRPQDVWALRWQVGQALSKARPQPARRLRDLRTPPRLPVDARFHYVAEGELPPYRPRPDYRAGPSAAAKRVAARPGASKAVGGTPVTLQGRAVTRDAIIEPREPARTFGTVAHDNRIMRANGRNAFLVWFDLAKLELPAGVKVRRATVTIRVWDPSNKGRTKLVAYPLKTAWDEAQVCWNRPGPGAKWRGGAAFSFDADAGGAGPHVVVEPDRGSDIANPPVAYDIDVTACVQQWLGGSPNHGVAIAAEIDRKIDNGHWTRFQVHAADSAKQQYAPKLTVVY